MPESARRPVPSQATYVWVRETPLEDASGYGGGTYEAGDEVPYGLVTDSWDEIADGIAVLDEDGELIEDVGAALPTANPDRVDDVLADREES